MHFKILFSSFFSPHYLKDNFCQTFECIPRKRRKSLFTPHPKLVHLPAFVSAQGEGVFQHGCYSHYVGSVKFIWKPGVWEMETALLLVQCFSCLLGLVLAAVL